jgi:hypothetical protein
LISLLFVRYAGVGNVIEMLSEHDLKTYRDLDGKKGNFYLLNVDIHAHSKLLVDHDAHEVSRFYKLSARFFELAVETNHGFVAPWQGDGGFAIFNASDEGAYINVWNAASDFLTVYQNSILNNLLNQIDPKGNANGNYTWTKNYPKYYCLIDLIELVFDFDFPGSWCSYALSKSLKEMKQNATPNEWAITQSAYKSIPAEHWDKKKLSAPKEELVYHTTSFGRDSVISHPYYRERLYKQQADNIAARNKLTECLIEHGFTPEMLLDTALHLLSTIFLERDDLKHGRFRASVWKRVDSRLVFEWGYPTPDEFKIAKLAGTAAQFQIGEGCAGKVWETGVPILSPDLHNEVQFVKKHNSHSDASGAFFPILTKERCRMDGDYHPDQLVGVLCLGVTHEAEFRFVERDAAIIETYVTPFTLNMALAIKMLRQTKGASVGILTASLPSGDTQ